MNSHAGFQQCSSYVAAHMHSDLASNPDQAKPCALTISRQCGARGRTIGSKLQAALRESHPKDTVAWTLFDDDLVKRVLEDHELPKHLEKFMPDDAVSEIEASINELLGRHPSLWSLFEKTVSTIVRLSRMGNCIIVGRGGNEITQNLPNVLKIRLVGSEEKRLYQITHVHGMSEAGARKYIKEEDAARRRYIKQHFGRDIDDPMRYDLMINTDHLDDDSIVRMLTTALQAKR